MTYLEDLQISFLSEFSNLVYEHIEVFEQVYFYEPHTVKLSFILKLSKILEDINSQLHDDFMKDTINLLLPKTLSIEENTTI